MTAAYVLGLPTPSASSSLTKVASLYLGGGFVLCSMASRSAQESGWPSSMLGRTSGVPLALPPAPPQASA